jgi:hypothetical protein
LQDIVDNITAKRKHRYQINFKQALSIMKNISCRLLDNLDLVNLINSIHQAFLKALEAIRPGRHYKRKQKNNAAYKPSGGLLMEILS